VKVQDVCKEGKGRLAELRQDDLNQLLSLALGSQGQDMGAFLRIVWFDYSGWILITVFVRLTRNTPI
jgi:hypothetical protein